jgi:hypothetical protein
MMDKMSIVLLKYPVMMMVKLILKMCHSQYPIYPAITQHLMSLAARFHLAIVSKCDVAEQ